MSSAKWLVLGEILVGLGGALAVAVLIWALQAGDVGLFWGWPGIAGVAIAGLGAVSVIVGLIRRDADAGGGRISQRQRSGANSVNYQAGGDLHVDGR